MHRLIAIFLILAFLGLIIPPVSAQESCPGAPPPRLAVGMRGALPTLNSPAVHVREQAGIAGAILGKVEGNTQFDVIGGPACADFVLWWQVRISSGPSGWIAEGAGANYYVRPISPEIKRFGNGTVSAVAWSWNGKVLAVGGSLGIWLYTDRLQIVAQLDGHTASVTSIAWSPDGRRIASASADKTVRVWDLTSRRGFFTTLFVLSGHIQPVTQVAWSPAQTRIATIDGSSVVRIWDAATGQQTGALGHSASVRAVAWHPRGAWIAVGGDGFVQVWDVARGQIITRLEQAALPPVQKLTWHPDGKTLAVLHQGTQFSGEIFAWDVNQNVILPARIDIPLAGDRRNGIIDFAWRPGGNGYLAVVYDESGGIEGGSLAVLRPYVQRAQVFTTRLTRVVSLDWRSDGRVIALADSGGQLYILDGGTLIATALIGAFGKDIRHITWDARGEQLLSYSVVGDLAQVWDALTGKFLQTVPLASLIPPQTISEYSATLEGNAINVRKGDQFLYQITDHTAPVVDVRWRPDGLLFASASEDQTVRIWDTMTGTLIMVLRGHSAPVRRIAWSPDGLRLASAGEDYLIRIWNAQNGKLLMILSGHRDTIAALSWNASGTRLLSQSADNTYRLWSVE